MMVLIGTTQSCSLYTNLFVLQSLWWKPETKIDDEVSALIGSPRRADRRPVVGLKQSYALHECQSMYVFVEKPVRG